MRGLKEKLIRIFYPHRCCVCDRILLSDEPLCGDCRKNAYSFPYRERSCEICGLPEKLCGCGAWRYYEKAVYPLPYRGEARTALHALKFRGRTDKIRSFAKELERVVRERDMTDGIDLVTFIPMAEKHRRKRGYNQAEELATALAKRLELPCRALLYRLGDGKTQHRQSFVRRQGNVLGVYEPLKEEREALRDKGILVVDDILTSGATLNEAAKTLLIFGAGKVFVAAVAGQPKKTKKPQTNRTN